MDMPAHYNLRSFLRQVSRELLNEIFQHHAIETGLDLSALKKRQIDPIFAKITPRSSIGATGCHCPTRPGSPGSRCRYPVLDGGVRDIKIHSNTVPLIRSVTTATVQHRF
jgi:hypothetical protein